MHCGAGEGLPADTLACCFLAVFRGYKKKRAIMDEAVLEVLTGAGTKPHPVAVALASLLATFAKRIARSPITPVTKFEVVISPKGVHFIPDGDGMLLCQVIPGTVEFPRFLPGVNDPVGATMIRLRGIDAAEELQHAEAYHLGRSTLRQLLDPAIAGHVRLIITKKRIHSSDR